MGNSCKCISKQDPKNYHRRVYLSQTDAPKRTKLKSHRWELVQKRYSSFPNPFDAFMQSKPSKFAQYLTDGPPPNLRWEIWKSFFSIDSKKITMDLSEQADSYSIAKDVDRTFPSHPLFMTQAGQQSLKNVLTSMVNNHPELGYCQGMNSVAGILLIESKGNEAESYAMLECICETLGGKGLFDYGFPLVVDLCEEFHRSLSEKIPSIHTFFQSIELDDNLWITKWFMTLFSYSFHYDCVIRIWDAIFANGLGFMVNIALGLVSYLKHDLMGKSLSDILEYIPELKEMYVDIDMVLFHSSNFQVKQFEINVNSDECSETLQEDLDEPIRTKWEGTKYEHQHSISMMEEFSISSSSNISKFSV